MIDDDDNLELPDFLKRQADPKPIAKLEGKPMVRLSESEEAVEAETETVKPAAKPAKAKVKAKGNGASPKPVKATSKPAKAKAGPAKAPKAVKAKAERDKFDFREGSLKSKAAAMYAAKGGATLGEVKDKLGSVQLNLLKDLEAKGHKVKKVKEDGDGARKVTRYFLS